MTLFLHLLSSMKKQKKIRQDEFSIVIQNLGQTPMSVSNLQKILTINKQENEDTCLYIVIQTSF